MMKGFEIGTYLRNADCPGLHMGLAMGSLAPVGATDGKIPDDARGKWLAQLSEVSVNDDYKAWFDSRWRKTIGRAIQGKVEAKSRLLVGAGDPSAVDVGLRVHHTWGVPFIPGSALKGLLSHWLETSYGPSPDHDAEHPLNPQHPEPERAKYRRAHASHGAGEIQRILFGSPESDDDRKWFRTLGVSHGSAGTTACRGRIVIHDALFFPSEAIEKPFLADVLTVHHANYYQGKGRANDYESPNPVGFLSVRPGAEFLLAVELAPGENAGYEPWVDFAHKMLIEALADWGIGSKTAAGYGRLDKAGRHVRVEQPVDSIVEELEAWLEANVDELQRDVESTDGPTAFVAHIERVHGASIKAATGEIRKQRKQKILTFLANKLRLSGTKRAQIRTKFNESYPD